MLKTRKLIHPSFAREVPEADAARLRQAGWLELAETKSVSKQAAGYRRYSERFRKLGFRQFTVWLSPETHSALVAAKLPNENTLN